MSFVNNKFLMRPLCILFLVNLIHYVNSEYKDVRMKHCRKWVPTKQRSLWFRCAGDGYEDEDKEDDGVQCVIIQCSRPGKTEKLPYFMGCVPSDYCTSDAVANECPSLTRTDGATMGSCNASEPQKILIRKNKKLVPPSSSTEPAVKTTPTMTTAQKLVPKTQTASPEEDNVTTLKKKDKKVGVSSTTIGTTPAPTTPSAAAKMAVPSFSMIGGIGTFLLHWTALATSLCAAAAFLHGGAVVAGGDQQ